MHTGDTDRHLHGLAGGCLRRLLQLRQVHQDKGAGGEYHMTTHSQVSARSAELPPSNREQQVLDRIERARRRRAKVKEERITLAHGSGGKATQTLIEAIFLESFRNPLLEPLEDAAELAINGTRLALTTDSFVVSPLFFPGGNIGDLAV